MSLKDKLWKKPKSKWLFGVPFGALLFAIIGAVALGAFQFGIHITSSTEFCSTCHIGMDTVVEEYKQSVHFTNRTGVRAECSDCHIPAEFLPKLIEKATTGTRHMWAKLTKDINLENFESEHRARMAEKATETIRELGSSTCMTCHSFDRMNLAKQSKNAKKQHPFEKRKEQTCVDCHSGVAHKLAQDNLDDLFAE